MDMFEVYPFNLALEVLGNKQLVLGMSTKYFLKAVHGLLGVEKTVVVGLYKEEKTLEKIAEENRIRNIEEVKEKAIKHLKELENTYKAIPLSMVNTGVIEVEKERIGGVPPVENEEYTRLLEAYNKLYVEYEILLKRKIETGEIINRDMDAIKINDIELSVRAYNVLKRAGYEYINELGKMSYDDLLKIKGMGVGTLREITKVASDLGVMIKGA